MTNPPEYLRYVVLETKYVKYGCGPLWHCRAFTRAEGLQRFEARVAERYLELGWLPDIALVDCIKARVIASSWRTLAPQSLVERAEPYAYASRAAFRRHQTLEQIAQDRAQPSRSWTEDESDGDDLDDDLDVDLGCDLDDDLDKDVYARGDDDLDDDVDEKPARHPYYEPEPIEALPPVPTDLQDLIDLAFAEWLPPDMRGPWASMVHEALEEKLAPRKIEDCEEVIAGVHAYDLAEWIRLVSHEELHRTLNLRRAAHLSPADWKSYIVEFAIPQMLADPLRHTTYGAVTVTGSNGRTLALVQEFYPNGPGTLASRCLSLHKNLDYCVPKASGFFRSVQDFLALPESEQASFIPPEFDSA
ncbi:MAG TPA: hypothetical protein VFK16_07095 [Gemmatimonadaceae bacterium]|nr:hypothetical protein [Gemmatimonadaceae bacterium]